MDHAYTTHTHVGPCVDYTDHTSYETSAMCLQNRAYRHDNMTTPCRSLELCTAETCTDHSDSVHPPAWKLVQMLQTRENDLCTSDPICATRVGQ